MTGVVSLVEKHLMIYNVTTLSEAPNIAAPVELLCWTGQLQGVIYVNVIRVLLKEKKPFLTP